MPLIDPDRVIEAPGPWTHRQVSANGARFHVVEVGEGPAVLLMHGFPMFWWTWRHQLIALADAGYRAIAMDLRGYGGSDHPPHGYDPTTQAADAAGVLRSLGVPSAYVIGHGWGAFGAWSMAVLEPAIVRGIVPISMPHPRAMRSNLLRSGQWTTLGYMLNFQMPLLPERSLRLTLRLLTCYYCAACICGFPPPALMSNTSTSKIRFAFGPMLGRPCSPYAIDDGM